MRGDRSHPFVLDAPQNTPRSEDSVRKLFKVNVLRQDIFKVCQTSRYAFSFMSPV